MTMTSNDPQVHVEYVVQHTGWSNRGSWFKLSSFSKETDAILHMKTLRELSLDQDWDYRVIKKTTLTEVVEYARFGE